ncbi:hypothetical protein B0H21DRAFT_54739 [Amylocystis lapponica]|nr:hypothetical protein B0H21DRAFT_54739 [Amylocystis lapponica]
MSGSVSPENEQTACMRCLSVDDIFQHILSHLHDLGKNGRSVASLSETCRSFRDASLPVLWSHLYSFVPLSKLLSPDRVLECGEQSGHRLSRLEEYAQHVKVFEWNDNTDFERNVLGRFFSQYSPPAQDVLFPNLHSLLWTDSRPELYPYLLKIAGPGVLSDGTGRKLRLLNVKTSSDSQKADIAQIAAIGATLFQVLHAHRKSLAVVQVGTDCHLNANGVSVLAQMPHLITARVTIKSNILSSLRLSRHNFLPLENLEIHIDCLNLYSLELLECIGSENLKSLVLKIDTQPQETQTLQNHLDVLERAPFKDALRCLHVIFGKDCKEGTTTITSNALAPLFCLPLIEISLSIARLKVDECLTTLAKNFPEIEVLHIEPPDGGCVPLKDLISLSHCNSLKRLGLRVSFLYTIPDSPRSEFTGPSYVTGSPLADPEPVAQFLGGVFPKLRRVHYGERGISTTRMPVLDEVEQTWRQVCTWTCMELWMGKTDEMS